MHTDIFLSLGSNLGDRFDNIQSAMKALGSLGEVATSSSIYETAPVGVTTQPWFLNCALRFQTGRMPRILLAGILRIERDMGRRRNRTKGPRIIDIDILLYGNSIVHAAGLEIPHPAMHERRFVLEPMTEIAPDFRHPLLKRTMRELRDALPTGQSVKKLAEFSP